MQALSPTLEPTAFISLVNFEAQTFCLQFWSSFLSQVPFFNSIIEFKNDLKKEYYIVKWYFKKIKRMMQEHRMLWFYRFSADTLELLLSITFIPLLLILGPSPRDLYFPSFTFFHFPFWLIFFLLSLPWFSWWSILFGRDIKVSLHPCLNSSYYCSRLFLCKVNGLKSFCS